MFLIYAVFCTAVGAAATLTFAVNGRLPFAVLMLVGTLFAGWVLKRHAGSRPDG